MNPGRLSTLRNDHDADSKRYFDWIYHAQQDYLAATTLKEDVRCFNSAAFHCQQCIEKSLKAYLLFKNHRLYDGHNLTWLLKQVVIQNDAFKIYLSRISQINRFYIETRYPADIPIDVDTETMNSLLQITHDILELICQQIKFDKNNYK